MSAIVDNNLVESYHAGSPCILAHVSAAMAGRMLSRQEPMFMPQVQPIARPPSREILSGNLIVARARARISQSSLADAAGVTR